MNTTNDIIRDYIQTEIAHNTLEKPLDDNDQLVESGIVDSLGVMLLLGFLDEKFSVQVSGDDLIPENFGTISAIAALIERQSVK